MREPQQWELGLEQWVALGPGSWKLVQTNRHPSGKGAWKPGPYGNTIVGLPKPGPDVKDASGDGLAWDSRSEPGVDMLATSRSRPNPL